MNYLQIERKKNKTLQAFKKARKKIAQRKSIKCYDD